jgi:hypothetical protein
MTLLRHYGIASDDNETFDVKFEIPNNCSYSVNISGKIKYINIDLNSGQTIPSSTFIMYSEEITTVDGNLSLQFKQTENGVTKIKPKLVITQ